MQDLLRRRLGCSFLGYRAPSQGWDGGQSQGSELGAGPVGTGGGLGVTTTAPTLSVTRATGRPHGPVRVRRETPVVLRMMAASIVLLAVLAGVAGALATVVRQSATSASWQTAEPLMVTAQTIDTSLSDADTTAAASFLQGRVEPATLQQRYRRRSHDGIRRRRPGCAGGGIGRGRRRRASPRSRPTSRCIRVWSRRRISTSAAHYPWRRRTSRRRTTSCGRASCRRRRRCTAPR